MANDLHPFTWHGMSRRLGFLLDDNLGGQHAIFIWDFNDCFRLHILVCLGTIDGALMDEVRDARRHVQSL